MWVNYLPQAPMAIFKIWWTQKKKKFGNLLNQKNELANFLFLTFQLCLKIAISACGNYFAYNDNPPNFVSKLEKIEYKLIKEYLFNVSTNCIIIMRLFKLRNKEIKVFKST